MAILGIDEVGRGPLAGPLVVGAVILPEEKPEWISELKDSKKLSAKKREKLAEVIRAEVAYGLGFVTAGEIDRLGMTEALRLGARRAVSSLKRGFREAKFSEIIIDGNMNFLAGTVLEKYVTTLIKGDDLIKEISAASIVAKVARDKYMERIAAEYPEYGFEKHVGYGTKLHRDNIAECGLCPEHRRLIKSLRPMAEEAGEDLSYVFSEEKKGKDTTSRGLQAEEAVARYLEEQGHEIVGRNFKTKLCEIDVISLFEEKIYFTEVKYRKTEEFGGGLAAVDREKLKRMKFAAECYMKFSGVEFDPLLAVAAVTGEEFEEIEWFPVV